MTAEENKAYQRRYYQQHKAEKQLSQQINRDRARKNERRYEQAHRETRTEKCEEYRQRQRTENTEDFYKRGRAATEKWRAEHPNEYADSQFNHNARRQIRIKQRFVEHVSRKVVYARDKGRCHICKKKVAFSRMHLDHIIPLCVDGEHSYANVAVSCQKCNLRKPRKRYKLA